jgi:excisionase family DNA binding protein
MQPEQYKKLCVPGGVPEAMSARAARADDVASVKTKGFRAPPAIAFCDRPTCRIDEACEASGLGRSSIYEAMKAGRLAFSKVGKRTLISVPSLLHLIGVAR